MPSGTVLNPVPKRLENRHNNMADVTTSRDERERRRVKPFIVSEISVIRKTRCPQINYEEKSRPGMFKRRLSAEDIIMGRYKYIPVTATHVKEKSVLKRQKKLLAHVKRSGQPIPTILLPPGKANKENVPLAHQKSEETEVDAPQDDNVIANGGNDKSVEDDNEIDAEVSPRAQNEDEEDVVFLQAEESDDSLSDDVEQSEGFGEYVNFLVEKKRDRKLNSDDFDTDLDSSETEEEEEVDVLGRKKPSKVNKTLENYERACIKCQMRPNATFLRQCGRSSLDIRYRMLTYRDAKPIAIALVDDKKTSFLDLSHNPLGPLGVSALADMLEVNKTVIELNLSSTAPESEGIQSLAKCLSHNRTLRRLYLENNQLQAGDGNTLASLIENASSLMELHLANNNLGFDGTKQIAKVLALNTGSLNVLNLSYNNIRTDSAAQLATALKKNTILRSLDLSWNGFSVEGCRALSSALEVNSTLRDLNLTCNRLGIKSLGFLLKGLIKNRGLHCIRLGMNPLTTEGAKSLVSAITSSKDSILTELDLKGIPIDEEFFHLKETLTKQKVIRVHYDENIHLGTSDISRESDGTFLDNFSPLLVMYEYMKKDNLRVIDFFQFFDTRKRDKLSKSDLANGFSILLIPFTQHHVDIIMKTLDTDKDGFISLDEMSRGYTKSDKIVKKRRIKASRMKKTDEGLEHLWIYLKSLIVKRKEENVKKNAAISQARRESRRASIMPGIDGRRGSIMPGTDSRRGSIMPGSEGRRGSGLIPMTEGERRGSLVPGHDTRRSSGSRSGSNSRRGSGSRRGSNTSGLDGFGKRNSLTVADASRRGSAHSEEQDSVGRRISLTVPDARMEGDSVLPRVGSGGSRAVTPRQLADGGERKGTGRLSPSTQRLIKLKSPTDDGKRSRLRVQKELSIQIERDDEED